MRENWSLACCVSIPRVTRREGYTVLDGPGERPPWLLGTSSLQSADTLDAAFRDIGWSSPPSHGNSGIWGMNEVEPRPRCWSTSNNLFKTRCHPPLSQTRPKVGAAATDEHEEDDEHSKEAPYLCISDVGPPSLSFRGQVNKLTFYNFQ